MSLFFHKINYQAVLCGKQGKGRRKTASLKAQYFDEKMTEGDFDFFHK
jgi:hypothetical protein